MQSKYIEFSEKGLVKVKTEEILTDNLGIMEVIIENETSIISAGTELARLNGMEKGIGFPDRPGYGSIGRIIAKGEGVIDFEAGDRVFFAGKHASVQRFQHGENHQWGYLFPVPGDIDPVEASVGCMAEIAMTAPNITEIKLRDTVAVFGLGMIGLLAAKMYQLKGANVIGVDPVKERCKLAREAGLEHVIDVAPDNQITSIKELTGGKGAEVTVDAVGHSAVICNCIHSTADLGQVLLLGSPRAPYNTDITEAAFGDIHLRGLVVRGAHMFRFPIHKDRGSDMNVQWAYQTIFELIKTKKLDVRKLISHVIMPDQAPKAYEGLQNKTNEYTCVVIDWRQK